VCSESRGRDIYHDVAGGCDVANPTYYFDLVAQGVDFAGAIDVSNIATQEPEVADVRKQDMTPNAPTAVEISDEKKAQLKKSGKELDFITPTHSLGVQSIVNILYVRWLADLTVYLSGSDSKLKLAVKV
jgi:hypothetical protein